MKIDQIRFSILVFFLLLSLYFIFSPFLFKTEGVVVNFVENEKCTLEANSIITEIKNIRIKSLADFLTVEKNLKKGEYVSLIANGEPAFCTALADGNLGVKVSDIPSKKIKFSGEIQGWKEITFSVKDEKELDKIKEVVEKRIDFFGIPSTRVKIEDGLIKIRTIFPEEIFILIEKGEIEVRIEQEIKLENDVGKILIGDESYQFKVVDKKIEFNNSFYETNESFVIKKLKIFITNITNKSVVMETTIFENAHLKQIGDSKISYQPSAAMYQVEIPVSVSEEASNNFVLITKKLPAIPLQLAQLVLQAKLVYYLDGKRLGELSIPYEMKGKSLQTISITFFEKNQANALSLSKRIKMGLIGVLPELKFIIEYFLKPTHYQITLYLNLLFFIIFSSSVLFLNRKNLTYGLKVLGFAFSCIFILLGIASFSQQIFSFGWVLDLPSFLGFFAVASVFLVKELIRKKEAKLKIFQHLELILLVVGFCSLFFIRGLGISIFFGILIKLLLINPLLKT